MVERVHKNTKRLHHHAISFDDATHIVKYLQNYAEQNAVLLPGHIPGYKRDDMKLLPCSESKGVNCMPNYTVMDIWIFVTQRKILIYHKIVLKHIG